MEFAMCSLRKFQALQHLQLRFTSISRLQLVFCLGRYTADNLVASEGLKLDGINPGIKPRIYQSLCQFNVPIMVDPSFSNNKARISGTDFAACNVNPTDV
jgi:hypothetical protein